MNEVEPFTGVRRSGDVPVYPGQATVGPLLVAWIAGSYATALTAPIRDAWRHLVERARVELDEKPGPHVIATMLALGVVEDRPGVLALAWRDHWSVSNELTNAARAVVRSSEGHLVEWARALEQAIAAAATAAGSRAPTDESVERFHAVRARALTSGDVHRIENEVAEAFERERRRGVKRECEARDAKYPDGWMVSDGRVIPRRSGQGAIVIPGVNGPPLR